MRLALIALLLVAGIAPSAAPAATTKVVELRDDSFEPATVRIAPGDSVMWVNRGRNPHDIVANDGAFGSKILQTGDTFTVTFPKVGRFPYFCSLHGKAGLGMHGEVYVGLEDGYADTASASRSYPADPPVRPAGGRTLRVPRDFATIQAAVDATRQGDLVLIAAGTYREAVIVTTPHITLRGEDRNRVILEGGYDPALKNGIAVFGADGVVIENMTARHYALNGFYWRSVWGYRGSFLTADGNGDYGIYAFDSGVGQFDHSYASGSPDSGFYIGQCDPCNALITDVIAEHNALGYSGTNASGNLVIRDSEWAHNMAGIAPNTLDREALAPQRATTIVNNWVHDNDDRTAPAKGDEYPFLGMGIVVVGGRENEVAYNRVSGHSVAGVVVSFVVDAQVWLAESNRVHDNSITGSGIADLVLVGPAGGGNCFASNAASITLPPLLETLYACGSPLGAVGGGDLGVTAMGLGRLIRGALGAHPHGEPRSAPPAPEQPSMPDVAAVPAPAGPASRVDPAAEVARARGRAAAAPGSASALAPAIVFVLFGEIAPLAALVAGAAFVVAGIRGRRLRLRFALVPLAAFVLFLLALFASALVL